MTQDEIINKDEILRIARECGDWNGQTAEFNDVGLEHFAALVAEATKEKAAKVADEVQEICCRCGDMCAAAIRSMK